VGERFIISECYDRTDNGYDAVIYYFTRVISAVLFLLKLLKIKLGPRLTIVRLPRLKTVFSNMGVTLLITLAGGRGIYHGYYEL